ncbi:MAG: hypothetical protein JWN85_2121 [Gammaproteobacteria bacterium]|nr:hypothetical protein [Gammaproteobacteria bacterium]
MDEQHRRTVTYIPIAQADAIPFEIKVRILPRRAATPMLGTRSHRQFICFRIAKNISLTA